MRSPGPSDVEARFSLLISIRGGREAGWTRSFRRGRLRAEIASHVHALESLLETGRGAGLELCELVEPHFGDAEREIFHRAGKDASFDDASRIPAVLVTHWKRL